MDELVHNLRRILFSPVYYLSWLAFAYVFASVGKTLYRTRGRSAKGVFLLLFLAALPAVLSLHVRSTRYIFLLAFPITFFVALLLTDFASLFRSKAIPVLTVVTAALVAGNSLKVLHVDPNAGFAATAAKKLEPHLRDVSKDEVLFIGSSRDLGRIAHRAGCHYLHYRYPIDDAADLALLKERFRDKYKKLILIYTNRPAGYSSLPESLFSVPKGKKGSRIYFYRMDLSPSPEPAAAERREKNLFRNPELKQPMDANAVRRIKTYFADNPEVLKIVERPGFLWPSSWPFDHAENYFPRSGFDLGMDKNDAGGNAIRIRSRSRIPFFHACPLPMANDYRLSLTLQFLEDSDVAVTLYLKNGEGRMIDIHEIKAISGKAGEKRSFLIPVHPGKLQRLSEKERRDGTIFFFFALERGDVRFSDFVLCEAN